MKKFFLRNWDWPNGVDEAHRSLNAGAKRHDVLEKTIMTVESDPKIRSVAYGGAPNLLGVPQFDAAFMDGNTRELGAIAGAVGYTNPVRIARKLMESGLHTMIAGADGITLFAKSHGIEQGPTLSPEAAAEWEKTVKPRLKDLQSGKFSALDLVRQVSAPREHEPSPAAPHDTTVMAASDGQGLSVATSTAGWDYKHPGRVGDSPVCGAGFYVDSRYGACMCTHTGEVSMRAGAARSVVFAMASGKSLHDAVEAAINDISALRGGHLGALVIHAIDADGNPRVVALNAMDGDQPVRYRYWREGMDKPALQDAEYRKLPNLG
jgi:L-asparaginase